MSEYFNIMFRKIGGQFRMIFFSISQAFFTIIFNNFLFYFWWIIGKQILNYLHIFDRLKTLYTYGNWKIIKID